MNLRLLNAMLYHNPGLHDRWQTPPTNILMRFTKRARIKLDQLSYSWQELFYKVVLSSTPGGLLCHFHPWGLRVGEGEGI